MSDKIIMHEDSQGLPFLEFVAHYYRLHGHGEPLPPLNEAHGVVVAHVNHGRWIVDCHAKDGCAMVASRKVPFFLCVVCGNAKNNGHWYNVKFPESRKLTAIEAALSHRPIPNRNWEPEETVTQLEAENLEHGVEVR